MDGSSMTLMKIYSSLRLSGSLRDITSGGKQIRHRFGDGAMEEDILSNTCSLC